MDTRQTLLNRIGDADRSKDWTEFVELYSPIIEKWLIQFSIPKNESDDLLQEVLLTLTTEVKNFQHNGRLGAFRKWLRAITQNRCRRYWQSCKRAGWVQANEQMLNELEDPDSELSQRWNHEHDQHLLSALLKLVAPDFSSKTRQIFTRIAIDNVSAKTVAAEMGIKIGQVYKARFRVMARLQHEANRIISKV